jgi:hypothetical protein
MKTESTWKHTFMSHGNDYITAEGPSTGTGKVKLTICSYGHDQREYRGGTACLEMTQLEWMEFAQAIQGSLPKVDRQ